MNFDTVMTFNVCRKSWIENKKKIIKYLIKSFLLCIRPRPTKKTTRKSIKFMNSFCAFDYASHTHNKMMMMRFSFHHLAKSARFDDAYFTNGVVLDDVFKHEHYTHLSCCVEILLRFAQRRRRRRKKQHNKYTYIICSSLKIRLLFCHP